MHNKITRRIAKALVAFLAVMGVIFIALIIYWWPVIDRLIVRPCHYYPHTFADCREE